MRSPGPPPPLELTPAERREAESVIVRLPTGFLAVHPGSGAVAKNWPVDRFTEAARRLCGDRAWLFVRGPAEEGLPLPSGAIDTGVLPLRTLAAVLARARLFLGNDSGVAHLAAAAGTPTLALFGPTDPALWSPVGPAVATLRAPGRDLARLPVAEVVAAAAGLAPTSAASGPPSG